MFKKALFIWLDISIFMFFIIFVDFIIFNTLLFYWGMFFYVKEIFVILFIFTIFISFYMLGYFFNVHNIKIYGIKNYFKLYFSIFFRAMLFVVPTVGLIAYICKGSIESRILTIFIEILAGLPAIYWYLNTNNKK